MPKLLGKIVSENIKKDAVIFLQNNNLTPTVVIFRTGCAPDQISYEKNATKKLESCGIKVKSIEINDKMPDDVIINEFIKINNDKNIDGILVLRPLKNKIIDDKICELINPNKDLDAMSFYNNAFDFRGDEDAIYPATAVAVMKILDGYNIDLEGKNVVIVNRSMVVGKSLAMLMLNKNATVTICHSKTIDLKKYTKDADVIILATGKCKFFTEDYIKKDAVIIDVSINLDKDGNICGDIDNESIIKKTDMFTPVPGGVGVVTTSVLISNLIKCMKKENKF